MLLLVLGNVLPYLLPCLITLSVHRGIERNILSMLFMSTCEVSDHKADFDSSVVPLTLDRTALRLEPHLLAVVEGGGGEAAEHKQGLVFVVAV